MANARKKYAETVAPIERSFRYEPTLQYPCMNLVLVLAKLWASDFQCPTCNYLHDFYGITAIRSFLLSGALTYYFFFRIAPKLYLWKEACLI